MALSGGVALSRKTSLPGWEVRSARIPSEALGRLSRCVGNLRSAGRKALDGMGAGDGMCWACLGLKVHAARSWTPF